MDFEKEYKRKTLEPIVNYIESVMSSYSKEELEARIKKALPERESEDERIRQCIGLALTDVDEQRFKDFGTTLKDCLAYLEKQKDNKYAPRVLPCSAAWFEDGEEKQKEQKPADDSGTAEPDYGICDDYIPASLHLAMARHGWYAGHLGEDEKFVLKRKEYVARNWPADKDNLTQEQPAEWSEEDEHYFQNLIMAVDSTFSEGNTKNWLQNRFKSLRPQPHWKPSEEQVSILGKVFAGCELNTSERDSMVDLFYHIKDMI